MLTSTSLEAVYIGPDLAGFKWYFEVLKNDNESSDRCNDSVDVYDLFDLQFPNSVKGDQIAEVFGLKSYKVLVLSNHYGFELFKETMSEVKEFLQERIN